MSHYFNENVNIFKLISSSSRENTQSSFSIATRYHPEYRRNWRTYIGPGYLQPDTEWDHRAADRDSVETLHRRRYGQDWTFTDFDGQRESTGGDYGDGMVCLT